MMLALPAYAHELTPTYFDITPSIYNNVYKIEMKIFNRREDVKFYEIGVYDEQWNPIPFATSNKVVQVVYLKTLDLNIYVRERDVPRVTYVCTKSKLLKDDLTSTGVSSRICSKAK